MWNNIFSLHSKFQINWSIFRQVMLQNEVHEISAFEHICEKIGNEYELIVEKKFAINFVQR